MVLFTFFFLFDITWCMCCQDYGLCFGGGSYSAVYVPPPFCVYPMVLILHISPFFFLFYVLCAHFFLPLYPYVFLLPFVCFFHAWMKTFGVCGCICIICSHICILKWVYLTYFVIVVTIGQDSRVRHVMF